MSMHLQILIPRFVQKILSTDKILTITKGQNSVVNLQKLVGNNPNLMLVWANVYATFDQIPLIPSEDIEPKQTFDNNKEPKLS